MFELIHKRGWDSKVFDTGQVNDLSKSIYGTKIQNGLHDEESDGSFVECNPLMESYEDGVGTHRSIRTRCGEVRISDTGSESKQLAKVKTKNFNGISLKLKGHRTYGPMLETMKKIRYDTYDGVTIYHYPSYKGINIVLTIDNPQTALNRYTFSVKEYGCDYIYEETSKGVRCISSTGEDDIFINALYAKDANNDYGKVSIKLGNIVDGYQTIDKVIDPTWLGNAVGPVEVDPNITIDDDSGTLIDNMLSGQLPNNNNGLLSVAQIRNRGGADKYHELMAVDLSAITDVTVTLARFGIDIHVGTFDQYIEWHRVLVPWIEGTKNNAAATAGESAWNYRAHPTAWNTAGCLGDGTDRQAVAEGIATVTGLDSDYHLGMSLTTVQAWINNAADNHGVVVDAPNIVAAKYLQWRSSETLAGNKPYFYMEYTIGIAAVINNIAGMFGVGKLGLR